MVWDRVPRYLIQFNRILLRLERRTVEDFERQRTAEAEAARNFPNAISRGGSVHGQKLYASSERDSRKQQSPGAGSAATDQVLSGVFPDTISLGEAVRFTLGEGISFSTYGSAGRRESRGTDESRLHRGNGNDTDTGNDKDRARRLQTEKSDSVNMDTTTTTAGSATSGGGGDATASGGSATATSAPQQQQTEVDLSADEELAKKMQEQLCNEAEMAAEMDEVSGIMPLLIASTACCSFCLQVR